MHRQFASKIRERTSSNCNRERGPRRTKTVSGNVDENALHSAEKLKQKAPLHGLNIHFRLHHAQCAIYAVIKMPFAIHFGSGRCK